MVKNAIRNQPWILFLIVALICQQGNMLTYKLGGENATPLVFLTYSFAFQAVLNVILMLFFKSRGFPITLRKNDILPVLLIAVLYMANESLFVTAYRVGAPYAVATAILSVSSLLMMVIFGLAVLKEKLNRVQLSGVVVAILAIILIKVG